MQKTLLFVKRIDASRLVCYLCYVDLKEIKVWTDTLINSVEQVFLGKREVIEKIVVALLCRGHVLLEDVPGMGKTILARAFAQSLGGKFTRIQCTPDLMPADILGVSVYNPKDGEFHFKEGPIFTNILLVDEINRATPRTQSALLEAMGENQISLEGHTFKLAEPFLVLATENPVEFEGTFPLPEAQKDRFLLVLTVGYPTGEIEKEIIRRQRRLTHPLNDLKPVADLTRLWAIQEAVVKIYMDPRVEDYLLAIITATRSHPFLQLGASVRASLALARAAQAHAALKGRDYVLPEDVRELALSVLAKRIILKPEALFKGQKAERILEEILENTPYPELADAS